MSPDQVGELPPPVRGETAPGLPVEIRAGDAAGSGAVSAGPRQGRAGGRVPRVDAAICVTLLLLAFVVRLTGTVLFEGIGAPPNEGAFYDGVEFEQIARSLVEEGRYAREDGRATSFRAPGLPFLLAGVYAVAGPANFVAAHLVFCLIGALVVLPTWFLARRLAGRGVALVAGALVAGMPNLAYYSVHFSSEPLHTLALLAASALLAAGADSPGRGRVMIAGLWLGAAALARPVAAYFLPFFALAILFAYPAGRRIRAIAALATGLLIVVLPWTVRNFRVHGEFVLIASNGGSTFWGSNNERIASDPVLRGEWISTRLLPDVATIPAGLSEIERDRQEFEKGRQWILANPAAAIRLMGWKTLKLWSPFPTSPNRKFVLFTALGFLVLVPFVIPGLALLARGGEHSRRQLILMAAPVVATQVAALLFYGSARFRSPIEPILIIWASVAIIWLLHRVLPGRVSLPDGVMSRVTRGHDREPVPETQRGR